MKKWLCKVCGYIHEGEAPPDVCPICGVGPEEFEEIIEKDEVAKEVSPAEIKGGAKIAGLVAGGNQKEAIFKIGYGLYVVTSQKGGQLNGQVCNTVFQITSDPQRVAVALNHDNLTNEFVKASGLITINVLGKGNFEDIKRFGYQSGHKVNKFKDYNFGESPTNGCPVLLNAVAYLDLKIDPKLVMEVGTHTLFVGEVVDGGLVKDGEPITYNFYRANRAKPESWEG
ncbi:MAG: flavin reductase [Bacillota bacterium]